MRNLSYLRAKKSSLSWNPKLEATSKLYQPRAPPLTNKDKDKKKYTKEVFGALEEVIMMAEGRHKVLLGRLAQNGTNVR